MDRDGVIIRDVPDLCDARKVEIFGFSAKGIKMLNKMKMYVIIVTNQPQIAKGFCTEEVVKGINRMIVEELKSQGAVVDAVYYCPHHPEKGFPGEIPKYKIDCNCRKPKIGMLEQAKERFGIDMPASFMIGNTSRDIQTGENAAKKYPGFRSIQVGDPSTEDKRAFQAKPDFVAGNLLEAAEMIKSMKASK